MQTYNISTKYGNRYKLDVDGYVLEYSNGLKKNPGSEERKIWQVLGIAELKPFGNIGPIIPLHEAVTIKNFTFKNGKPKYTIIDLDHGTRRIHGNAEYHGVVSVSI